MRVRRAMLVGCLAAGVAAVIVKAAAGAIAPDTRLFELRVYTAAPGKIEALDARFRDHARPLFAKHNMTVVGYWRGVEKPDSFVYLLAFKDRAARDEAWKIFGADPAWQKARTESEVDGALIGSSEVLMLSATDYSPLK